MSRSVSTPTRNSHGYLFVRHHCPQPSFKKTWRFHPGSVHFKSADSIECQNGAEPHPPAGSREARTGHSKTAYAEIKGGDRELTLSLRTVAKPDADVATLLAHLGLGLPRGSRVVENVVEKTGR